MSWGFGGIAANSPQGATPPANTGADLEAIETEQLGFQALAGERKVKLASSAWPTDARPSKSASLLAVASGRRLVAAGGPEALALYDSDAIRDAFTAQAGDKVVEVSPISTTNTPRLSHLAFTSDESAVVITAERGGGLAVYDVEAAKTGSAWTPSFQISTESTAVRHLLPNPSSDASHLFAVVLEDGKLLLADLKSKAFVTTSGGSNVLRERAVCASWSKKGKQIVVGLADGTAVQMDTQGTIKDTIPRPPSMAEGQNLPVTAIYWVENQDYLLIHSPTSSQTDDADGMPALVEAFFHLVHRDKDTKACSFHRFVVDPCPPFLDVGLPPHHFIQRIRDWLPNLDDTLIVACTASTDVGVFTRSKVALSQDLPADQITHLFTTTSFTDTRRAALPMSSNNIDDTFPVGVALDLSSRQKVPKPIPNDETIDESAIPLPQLCVLNQEGVLSAWWYVYNEAVRAKIAAPSMDASTSTQSQSSNTQQTVASPFSTPAALPPSDKPAFGQTSAPTFGQTSKSAFGQPSATAFGQTSTSSSSTFGQPSAPASSSTFGKPSTPAFGQTSAFGSSSTPTFGKPSFGNVSSSTQESQSAFGSTPGKPSFGAPSQLGLSNSGSAFGQAGGMGFNKPSVWGYAAQGNTSGQSSSTSGQPSQPTGTDKPAENPFAAFGKQHRENAAKSGASPFAGFAQTSSGSSPFASFSSQPNNKLSPFAAQAKPGMPSETSFGSTVTLSSNNGSFGSASPFATSRFGQPSETTETSKRDGDTPRQETKDSSSLGDLGSFKLGSTFQSDGSAKDDKPLSKSVERSLFGSAFGSALGETASQTSRPDVAIKEEPSESQPVSLKDIPEISKPEQAALASQAEPPPSDRTPIKSEPLETSDAPLPPDFLASAKPDNKKAATDDAPLPPDFLGSSKKSTSPAGDTAATSVFGSAIKPSPTTSNPFSKPLFSNATKSTSPASRPHAEALPSSPHADEEAGPEENEDPQDWDGVSEDDDADEEEQSDEEGDEEDDDGENSGETDQEEWDDEDDDDEEDDDDDEHEEDASDADHTPQIVDPKRLAAFTSRITPASPKESRPKTESTTPESVQKPSFTPAGFPKVPVNFVPPRTTQESPRSPSPVRTDRAVTSPVRLSQTTQPSSVFQPLISSQHQSLSGSRLKASTGDGRSSLFPSKAAPPSIEALEDEDDARVQQILDAPVVPSKTLPNFIAHQDYTGASTKEGIAGQLERVYRDVNSMIDTLGLNARALQAFVAGNAPSSNDVSLDTLEDDGAWTVGDVYALEKLQVTIDDQLENGKLTDITTKVDEILEQDGHLDRLNAKAAEIRKQISARTDPAKRAQQQAAALPSESAAQQAELRLSVQNVQTLLAKVEESMGLLRADLATISATSSDANGTAAMPTVKAVTNTILKMTAMVEKKSGDVDLLEAQIKRLPGGLAALGMSASYEDGLIDSLAASKLSESQVSFTSPSRKRSTARSDALGMSGMFNPRSQSASTPMRQSTAFEPVASVLGRSTASLAGSARKKMADVTTEEVKAWRTRDAQRRNVLDSLRRVVASAGQPRIIRPSDTEG